MQQELTVYRSRRYHNLNCHTGTAGYEYEGSPGGSTFAGPSFDRSSFDRASFDGSFRGGASPLPSCDWVLLQVDTPSPHVIGSCSR